jgi:LysM repeat protein
MYWFINQIKLILLFSIITILFLHGCAVERFYPEPFRPYQYPDYYTNSLYSSGSTDSKGSHTVQRGETLSTIARHYGRTFKEIAAVNNISPPYTILPGQTLLIPGGSGYTSTGGSGYTSTGGSGYTSTLPVGSSSPRPQLKAVYQPKTVTSDYHTVQPGESLYRIATRYGLNFRQVGAWNQITPPYTLSVGQRLRIRPQAGYPTSTRNSAPTASVNKSISHVVQPGETVSKIAKRYGYKFSDIAQWNGLQSPYQLLPGRRLRVAPYGTPTTTGAATRTSSRQAIYHTVAPGENLYRIGLSYGVKVPEIAAWNNLYKPYNLSVGQRLKIIPRTGSKIQSPQNSITPSPLRHNSGYHTVAPGETLYRIATSYGYKVPQIAAWNRLQPPYHISVGQSLRVYPPSGAKIGGYNLLSMQKKSSLGNYHVVQKGETLMGLASQSGISADDLAEWNDIGPPYSLYPGQKIWFQPRTP